MADFSAFYPASAGSTLPSLGQATMAASLPVVIASDQSAVTVTAATLPLPSGAATSAKQDTGNTSLSSIDGKITACNTGAVVVSSSALPSGASTAAKQPALGTAGSASADVLTVQGIASMTALKVDGSGSTQPVSGTVAATQSGSWSLAANQSVNVAQINGVTPLMGNGVTGTGSQRVTIASDNTAFSVNAVQSGTWTVQPGNAANTTAWLVTEVPPSGSTNANSSLASTALEASHVIKASAGRLFQLTGVNTKSSAQYIQVFNSASVPADSTAPVLLAYVGAGANFSWDFGAIGRYFSTGISVSNSSTAATKTIGSADCWFNAEYI
jgi:hypothetical protein